MTPTEIKELVQACLDERNDQDRTIRVVGLPVLIDGQWQVLVEPTQVEPTPRFHYYEMLGEVEDKLSEGRNVSVFLTPAPEATYRYSIEEEIVEVKRRETTLFVSTSPWQGFWAVYSLEGERMGEVIVGKQGAGHSLLTIWEHRFDKAVGLYLDEKRHREEREQALTALGR